MQNYRGVLSGLVLVGLVFVTAGCGKAAPRRHAARTLDPALRAALEVMRLEPVVPFTPAQVQQLVPILQGLEQAPTESASDLAAKATKIEAVFTATQQEALKNMGPAQGFPGGGTGGTAGRAPRVRRFSGGAPGASGTQRFSRAGGGGAGGQFGGAAIYQRAIAVLQGQAPAAGAGQGATAGQAAGV